MTEENIQQLQQIDKPESIKEPISLQHQSPIRKWAGLGVLSLGLAIIIIDTTLLNVSLSYIIKDLNTNIQSLQWVITAYALVLAGLTITGGRLGDLFGRRKMFMLGAIIFAVGSFMASESHTIPILLLGESLIEGLGAALMMPATASLVVANFKGRERATAFGVWGAVAGASSAIGPLLGGYLATHYSWRWGFRINIFIAAIVILGSLLLISESRDERKPTLDWGGVVLSSLGLFGITYGIIESSTYGWWKAKELWAIGSYQFNFWNLSITPIALGLGLVLLATFFWWEKRVEEKGKSPLVSLKLFKNRQFTSGTLAVSILTLGMTGTFFALPIYLQAVKNMDAFHTGLVFLPLSASLLVVAPLAAFLSRKISPKYLIQFGLIMAAIGAFVIRWGITADGGTGRLIPGLIIFGVGMGFVMAPISGLTLSAVPVQEAGEASGVNNTMRQVGTSLGAAIVGAAVITLIGSYMTTGIKNSLVIPEGAKPQIIKQFSGANSNVEFGGTANITPGTPPQITEEVKNIAKQATTQAARDGYVYAAMFVLLAFAVALFLPKVDVHDEQQHITQAEAGNDPNRRFRFAGASAIALVALIGGVLFLRQSSKQAITTGATQNLSDIQNAFLPPTTPPSTPPTTPAPQPSTPTSSPVAIAPRGGVPDIGTATSTTRQPAAPQNQIYSKPNLGFELELTNNWQAQQTSDGEVILVSNIGEQASIQTYSNTGADIESIKNQLAGSQNVTEINWTTFHGQTALGFSTTDGQQGIALINNGKLYYIMIRGSLASSPISSFKFI